MRKWGYLFALFTVLFSTNVRAELECAIDLYKAPTSGQGQGAVLGGWAKGKSHPIFVTVKNYGIPYTTMTDRNGRWSIFFRLLSSRVSAEVWNSETQEFSECKDRSTDIRFQ